MRAKVSKNDILPAIMRTVSIADRKSIVPILSHVLLEFNESGLCIKATDLDHSIIEKIPAEVDTFGTAVIDENKLSDYIKENIDMRPAAIISRFDLRKPIYGDLAAYGHMGREDLNAPWERRDFAEKIKNKFDI